MNGITITFSKQVAGPVDAMGNPTTTIAKIVVTDCLIAPITEPANAREQQAMEQSRDQVQVHLPKKYTGNVSDSTIAWGGKVFKLDSDSVEFMNDNTPGRWNRYFRAESVNA